MKDSRSTKLRPWTWWIKGNSFRLRWTDKHIKRVSDEAIVNPLTTSLTIALMIKKTLVSLSLSWPLSQINSDRIQSKGPIMMNTKSLTRMMKGGGEWKKAEQQWNSKQQFFFLFCFNLSQNLNWSFLLPTPPPSQLFFSPVPLYPFEKTVISK